MRMSKAFCFVKMVPAFYFFALLLVHVRAEPILGQVHVITRSGSRFPPNTNSQTLKEDDSAGQNAGRLTMLGQQQMFNLGVWLRDRYADFTAVPAQKYPSKDVRLESSALDRTIASANSLSWGLFDTVARDPANETLMTVMQASYPVYTRQPKNDIYIRAFDKCDKFLDFLYELYESDEWLAIEKENEELLRTLGGIAAFEPYASEETGMIRLQELWNVYDMINVAKTECAAGACQEVPNASVRDLLSVEQWKQLEKLAHTVELMKFRPEVEMGRLISGNLLLEIADRMEHSDALFHVYSAHYPTILGAFSALGEEFVYSDAIPNYGSALIIEVYKESSPRDELSVEILYKHGDDSNEATVISRSVKSCAKDINCHQDLLSISGFSTKEWCSQCGNSEAGVCLGLALQELNLTLTEPPAPATNAQTQSVSCPTKLNHPVLAGLLPGFGATMVVMALALWLCGRKRQAVEHPVVISKTESSHANEDSGGVLDETQNSEESSGAQVDDSQASDESGLRHYLESRAIASNQLV